jgi:hypothetical protein
MKMNNAKKVLEIEAGHSSILSLLLRYWIRWQRKKKTANKITNLCCQQSASKKQKENKLVTSR